MNVVHRPAPSTPLRVGIIGLGRVASRLEDDPLRAKPCTHAGSYSVHPATRIVAGADVDAEAREAFRGRWGVERIYEDYREMLEVERLDIVSVCAYASDRAVMVIDAVESGARGIWCEKAIATSLDEARRMTESCRDRGVVTVVNYSRRWSPVYREAKRRIARGDIGEPQAIVSCFSGHLIHTGTHAFDVMRMLFGEVTRASGTLDASGEDLLGAHGHAEVDPTAEELGDLGGDATLVFANGAVGTVHARAKRYYAFSFEVIGREGAIRLGNETPARIYRPGPSRSCAGFTVLGPRPLRTREARPVAPQVDDLVRGILHDAAPASTLDDGTRALEIALAIHVSARDGAPVDLPIADPSFRVASR